MKHMFTFFEDFVEGADFYQCHGSLWLIFTEQKKWVFEVTKDGTLWYNYYFFDKIFRFVSLDLIENQNHITQWVESIIRNGVKNTITRTAGRPRSVEDTIQNGVKRTRHGGKHRKIDEIKDIVENGVKETKHNPFEDGIAMEEAIQNGVKRTTHNSSPCWKLVEDVVQNGVKETTPGGYLGFVSKKGKKIHQFESPKQNNEVEDIIQNGVKETYMEEHHRLREVVQTVKNGVKETNWRCVDNHPTFVDSVIESGIKEIWGYEKQPHTRVSEVIRNGVKEDPS